MELLTRVALGVIGWMTLVASPLSAGILTYDDRSQWQTDVTSLISYDFGTQSSAASYNTSSGLISSNFQVVGIVDTGYDLTRINSSLNMTYYNWGINNVFVRSGDKTTTNVVTIQVNFLAGGTSTAVNAFGFDLGGGGSGGAPINLTITPQGGPSYSVTTAQQPTYRFFGLTSDTQQFTSATITIESTNRYIVLDNLVYGTYTPGSPVTPPTGGGEDVPELAAVLYMGTGWSLIYLSRRRGWLQRATPSV